MEADLRTIGGGSGEPLLVLLHGLGATADVWAAWRPWLADRWPGRWVAPDLPGHGGSPALADYTFEALATAVAGLLDPDVPTVLFGHSMGGAVGLALATRHSAPVRAVIGLGIKVEWSGEELDRARSLADRPPVGYPSRAEAAERYLRVSGLTGLLAADDPAVDAGLRARDGLWWLTMDPHVFAVGAPDLPGWLARSRAAVILARGEHDPMNSDRQLAQFGVPTVTLPGLGHNAHVERPEQTCVLLDAFGSVPAAGPTEGDGVRRWE